MRGLAVWWWIWSLVLLAGCGSSGPSLVLFPSRARVGEEVEARLVGLSGLEAQVFVGQTPAEVTAREANRLRFRVPSVSGGPQAVRVLMGEREARGVLGVLGQVDPTRVLLRLPLGRSFEPPQGFTLLGREELGACGFALVELGYGGEALGRALDELEAQDPAYKADPESLWSLGRVAAGQVVGAPLAYGRGRTGNGVRVAVLDTGVDAAVPQLGGYDFVEDDAAPQDAFPGGHGTGAAGLVREVAPDAQIVPVRVCDERGVCRASRVVRGVCWVLAHQPGPTVLNLSLGGDTPVEALRLALEAALARGFPVVAAAGNQGQQGSPAHYPAAFDLPGLIAVGALQEGEAGWVPAPYSTRGAYVDLAAPGTDLRCVVPGGAEGSCTGTSFAAPVVAGAAALWLQARPGLSPVQLQAELVQWTSPLAYPPAAVGAGMLDLSRAP
ncbi:Subtilisin E [Meiothermus luteus]|uniref:Subtilisin E n=1 Tax=Meiothermus luteus TaxID=2026184 RepID=A0A399EFH9_9DEIN|nr:Subtilisin E [Meiothermus luteus]